MAHKKLRKARSGGRIGDIVIGIFLGIMVLITIYPFWHVVMYSLSDSHASMSGGIFLWPRDFSLLSYQQLLSTRQIISATATAS